MTAILRGAVGGVSNGIAVQLPAVFIFTQHTPDWMIFRPLCAVVTLCRGFIQKAGAENSDPNHAGVRKYSMLTTMTPSATPDHAPFAAHAELVSVDVGKVKIDNVQDEKAVKRAAWVPQLIAVRDHKDTAAFAELFAYFGPRVKSFLMRSGASPDLAEECTQEVMVTLWRKSHLFDPAKASVSTWIFTIARNRRIDLLRKQRRVEPEDLPWGPEADPDQADAIALQQETALLGKAIADLPEKQRLLIEQAYYGELTHSEIAAQTGLPLGTIKSRIRLALDRLRHAIG